MGIRKFLMNAGKFTTFQVFLIGSLLWAYYRPSVNGVASVYSATNIKHQKLRSSDSPRAIFVGGSNLMFGLESELIKTQTNYEPVNMGLVGGLRLSFMLNEIKRQLNQGDIVVLALEYNQLITPDKAAAPQVLMRVMEQRPQSIQYLNFAHWRLLLDAGVQEHLGIILRSSIERVFKHLPFFVRDDGMHEDEQVNLYGDLMTFREQPPQHEGAYQEVLPDKIPYAILDERIRQLNKFLTHVQRQNSEIVFTYPPIPESQYSSKKAVADEFHQILLASLDIPILGTPQDMVFNTDTFINESYHLHTSGIRERTQRLVNLMQTYDVSAVDSDITTHHTSNE